jgi:uncharacterized membrane protein YkvA (DUF1232 family)
MNATSMTRKVGLWSKAVRYLRDPQVALGRKLMGLWAVLYVASPIDMVPEFIPVLGVLDDVGVLGAFAWYIVRELRQYGRAPAGPPASRAA